MIEQAAPRVPAVLAVPRVSVTVVLAQPVGAEIRSLEMPQGATVAEAVAASGLLGESLAGAGGSRVGIFGRRVDPERLLAPGDQIELYLPLASDPKSRRAAVARRQRASAGRR